MVDTGSAVDFLSNPILWIIVLVVLLVAFF